MTRNSIHTEIFLLLFSFLLLGCANQLPPSGGPIDATTPIIILTYPENNARNFDDNKINLSFDRYVEERTVEESIFISPYIGILEFDWSGGEVEITFSEKLRRNTTYVVNIGTDVKDRFRNQMRMAKAYTLAFSTGPDIDRGGIEGLVFPRKESDQVAGVMIFAYQLNGLNPDTLNPIKAKPDFITQTGKSGDFFLHYIPFGSYRIFAIRDEYRNLVYDRQTDEYGVPSSIINITAEDTLSINILMRLAKEDTTGPMLNKVTANNRNHIVAEFSEPLNSTSITLSSFIITDTLDRKPLEILTAYPSPSTPTSFVVVTQNQDSTRTYHFSCQNISDSIGNKVNPRANSYIFQGSSKADTMGLWLASVSIKDSVQNVDLQPLLTLTFSDALAKKTSLDFVNVFDNNKQLVQVKKKWISDVMLSLTPEKELTSRMWYTLRADLHGVHDWTGHTCRDSLKSWHFQTLDLDDMSSIEGVITDVNRTDTAGRLYVTAIQIGERVPKSYTVVADATSKFIFPLVDEGSYVFKSFRDRNNNGVYDAGKPFPFVYSERLSAFSDTLKVRARWPLEGVKIEFK